MMIPREIFSIVDCASDNNGRYAIAGVMVNNTPDGPLAVATNGCSLIVAGWNDKDNKDKPIETKSQLTLRDDWIAMKKVAVALNKKVKEVPLDESKNANEHIFPKYQQIIPHYQIGIESVAIRLQPDQMALVFNALLKILDTERYSRPYMTLEIHKDPKKPMMIIAGEGDKPASAIAVVMPSAGDCDPKDFKALPQIQKLLVPEVKSEEAESSTDCKARR